MATSNPVVHFELPTENRERSKEFYAKAFGWKMIQMGQEMGNYVVAQTGPTDDNGMMQEKGVINGGLYEKTPEMPAQHPSVVISVDDIAKHIQIVKDAGGEVLGEPMDIPGVGRYVAFRDTEGNQLSMLQALPMNG